MDVNVQIQKKITNIATRLKQARIKAGYRTKHAFASANNVDSKTYYRQEMGITETTISCLIKYSKLLNTSFLWLVHGLDEHEEKTFVDHGIDGWVDNVNE